MPNTTQTGQRGEAIATAWLLQQGYQLLERNWRFGRAEVDIIASKAGVLHFIEVKMRTTTGFGLPEHKVNATKLRNLKKAAEAYLHTNPAWKFIQFDIVSIQQTVAGMEIFMIEDVF